MKYSQNSNNCQFLKDDNNEVLVESITITMVRILQSLMFYVVTYLYGISMGPLKVYLQLYIV